MSRRSRHSHQFAFQTADELAFEKLNFGRYEESIDQLNEEAIRQYIEQEAHAVQAERENDVSKIAFRGIWVTNLI